MPTPYPPADFRTGSDSYVERPSVTLATNMMEWNAAWQQHMGVTPIGNGAANFPTHETPPPVDFDHYELLVIFGGLAPDGGYSIFESVKKDDKIYLRLQPTSLSLNGGPSVRGFNANPYAFVLYKRSPDPIIVEFPTKGQDGSIQWNPVARVGGPAPQAGPGQAGQGGSASG